jgi:hypothetical protein
MTCGWGLRLRVNCLHGYFEFEEQKSGQISDFMSLFSFSLVRTGRLYTFEALEAAPDYAIKGGEFLGATVTKTFEGQPHEVMRENELVYNFLTDSVVPLSSITQRIDVRTTLNYFVSEGLILPGSVTDDGFRVRDYAAWYDFNTESFRYSEINFE